MIGISMGAGERMSEKWVKTIVAEDVVYDEAEGKYNFKVNGVEYQITKKRFEQEFKKVESGNKVPKEWIEGRFNRVE